MLLYLLKGVEEVLLKPYSESEPYSFCRISENAVAILLLVITFHGFTCMLGSLSKYRLYHSSQTQHYVSVYLKRHNVAKKPGLYRLC